MTKEQSDLFYSERNSLIVLLISFIYNYMGYKVYKLEGHSIYKTKLDNLHIYDEGWFIVNLNINLRSINGESYKTQISWHLPEKEWDRLRIREMSYNKDYDGHTKEEAVERLDRLTDYILSTIS